MTGESLYFQVAGFVLKLNFLEEEFLYFKKTLKTMLLHKLKNFAISKPNRVDFTIYIKSRVPINGIMKKGVLQQENYYTLVFGLDIFKNTAFTHYSLSEAQFEMLLKKILVFHLLPKNHGLFFHGSSISIKNKVFIFLGQSGAGKSTISEMLKELGEKRADDIFILRKINSKILFFQTPFIEKRWQFNKTKKPFFISKIFFLEKSRQNYIKKMANKSIILERFLNQYVSDSKPISSNQFQLLNDFILKYNIYTFEFNLDKMKLIKYFKNFISLSID